MSVTALSAKAAFMAAASPAKMAWRLMIVADTPCIILKLQKTSESTVENVFDRIGLVTGCVIFDRERSSKVLKEAVLLLFLLGGIILKRTKNVRNGTKNALGIELWY